MINIIKGSLAHYIPLKRVIIGKHSNLYKPLKIEIYPGVFYLRSNWGLGCIRSDMMLRMHKKRKPHDN